MAEARTFSEQNPIRVFLLDDHEVVRRGLTDLLDSEPDISVVGDGLTNREIGKELYLSEKTVKNHISRLLAKLGVQRRVQAAVLANHLEHPEPADHHRSPR
ncbi:MULTISPECIES: response regulator transcription factor [unclassified Streptomyces]|jgi:Response regulator containing a CheY-like receiver domain and an HTH DNA-binding domain|uniref:response regulator transcription factor n=1 Tax=unclassified Streptomyces TaxID=2593676 RepID=UPI002E274917